MKRNRVYLIAFICALTTNLNAQCLLELMLDKVNVEPFSFLKTYRIEIQKIEGVPFNVQYSYVFTKGTTYGFLLKESPDNPLALGFTLTDANGVVFNERLVPREVESATGRFLTFTAETTGNYYMNIYSEKSFNGCAMVDLYFYREGITISLTDEQQSFRKQFRALTNTSPQLKDFVIYPNQETSYSYVLSRGETYELFVLPQSKSDRLDVEISFVKSKEIISDKVGPNGLSKILKPKQTTIYRFKFDNKSKSGIGMASIKKIDPTDEK